MLQLTLLEKLQMLFDLILTTPFFIFLFIFAILFFIILMDGEKYDRMQVKKYLFGIYAIIFIAVIIKYHDSFRTVFDYLVNNVFIIFYFPNIAVYAMMVIIANIVMVKTIFTETDRVSHFLNILMYSIVMYLMLLIITTINEMGLDVYNQLSLYANSDILTLIEMSNITFVVWMSLSIINKLLDFLETRGLRIKSRLLNNYNRDTKGVERVVYRDGQLDFFTKEEYIYMLNLLKNRSK